VHAVYGVQGMTDGDGDGGTERGSRKQLRLAVVIIVGEYGHMFRKV
jgi:hypothetical protein